MTEPDAEHDEYLRLLAAATDKPIGIDFSRGRIPFDPAMGNPCGCLCPKVHPAAHGVCKGAASVTAWYRMSPLTAAEYRRHWPDLMKGNALRMYLCQQCRDEMAALDVLEDA